MSSRLDPAAVTAFFRTIAARDRSAVASAIDDDPRLLRATAPHPFWRGRPQALHVAIEARDVPLVRLLLDRGADPNGRNAGYQHWSPLLIAASRRSRPLIRLLLAYRAKVRLVEALALGADTVALQILRRGRAALPRSTPSRASLLAFARSPQLVDRLLALGVSATNADAFGATPMDAFSRLGLVGRRLVRHLAARGYPVPPTVWARLGDQAALARLAARSPDQIREPAVLEGAVDGRHRALAAWLLERGADPNARFGGVPRATALHLAAWNGDAAMVELFLRRRADPSIRDRQYRSTPAEWAETSVEVTGNRACRVVAKRLARSIRR